MRYVIKPKMIFHVTHFQARKNIFECVKNIFMEEKSLGIPKKHFLWRK